MLFSLLATLFAQDTADANLEGWSGSVKEQVPVRDASEYTVGSGDHISVIVVGEPSLSGTDLVVAADGSVNLPIVGRVVVKDRTAQEIEGQLTRLLAKDYLVDPQVSVSVSQFNSRRVEVLGLVEDPGVYRLEGPTTVLQVLAMAGGVSEEAITEVRVIRGAQTLVLQYKDLIRPGGDQPVMPGDQVYVPVAKVVYVQGQVEDPGAVVFSEGMTLTQALTLAGGLSDTAKVSKVYILRDGERIEVRLKRILKGKESDYVLRPDDQVFIDMSHV
ncbi:MAG: polysaccharide biosynthesis/export family protein [Myxococcota bacterium]|nr:polysaccharide biosynthesis/export family protein [Myxococcota bacterium]